MFTVPKEVTFPIEMACQSILYFTRFTLVVILLKIYLNGIDNINENAIFAILNQPQPHHPPPLAPGPHSFPHPLRNILVLY